MGRSLLLAASIALIPASAQIPSCITPRGVPCYSIRFVERCWSFNGLFDLQHRQSSGYQAARSDGSTLSSVTECGHSPATLSLASQNRVVTLDESKKLASIHVADGSNYRPHHSAAVAGCAGAVDVDLRLAGRFSYLGVAVERWVRGNSFTSSLEYYLAPTLDCIPLRIHRVERSWMLPTSISLTQAVEIRFTEPRPEMFAIPAGYTVEYDSKRNEVMERFGKAGGGSIIH